MKANDLRIGNYVQAPWDGHIYECEVKRIAEDYITLYCSGIMAKIKTHDGIFNCYIKSILPIPITIDLCLKLGAVQGFHCGQANVPWFPLKNGVNFVVCPLADCIRIYINGLYIEYNELSVNEVQNIYYALTHNELIHK